MQDKLIPIDNRDFCNKYMEARCSPIINNPSNPIIIIELFNRFVFKRK